MLWFVCFVAGMVIGFMLCAWIVTVLAGSWVHRGLLPTSRATIWLLAAAAVAGWYVRISPRWVQAFGGGILLGLVVSVKAQVGNFITHYREMPIDPNILYPETNTPLAGVPQEAGIMLRRTAPVTRESPDEQV